MTTQQNQLKDLERRVARRRRFGIYSAAILAVGLLVVCGLVLTVGSVHIPFMQVWAILVSHLPLVDPAVKWSSTTDMIVTGIRLPRILLAGMTGAALAVAGARGRGATPTI